jgi:hypothetical protein
MSTVEQTQTGAAAATTERYRAAAEAQDIEGLIATLAPDVAFNSPITESVRFTGHDEMRELLGWVFATISDIRFFADIGDDRTRALFFRGRVGSEPVEEAVRIELDDNARITELTAFFRPLPGLATLTCALAPLVVERRRGRAVALVVKVFLAPLGVMTRIGDRVIPWLT